MKQDKLPYLSKLDLVKHICDKCRIVRKSPNDECLSKEELTSIAMHLEVLGKAVTPDRKE